MAFWSASGVEPKRNYRWYVQFSSEALKSIAFALKKVDKPKAKIGEVPHKYLNHTFYYPGRLEWEAINMTFASVSDPDATAALDFIVRSAGYGVPSLPQQVGAQVSSIGKVKFNGAIGDSLRLIQVDADGNHIEEWDLYKPFFTSVQYGSLDYGNEEIVEITTTVRYDWAQLKGMAHQAEYTNPASPGYIGFPDSSRPQGTVTPSESIVEEGDK